MVRILLAISVAFAHARYVILVGPTNAVQLFYIISGFLISYVLDNNPAYSNPLRFYASRLLRLYPIYAAVAILVLMSHILTQDGFFGLYAAIPSSARNLLIISNLGIVGQDWIMFLAVIGGHLHFSDDFLTSSPMLWTGLLVPQAWSLGVELSFYAIAPLVVKRTRVVILLLLASVGLRTYLVSIGYFRDPWTYRFFPSELALFLAGVLSQRLLLPVFKRDPPIIPQNAPYWSVFGLIIIVCCYSFFPFHPILLFCSFIFLLPGAFIFQNCSLLDQKIGNLSYPIYVCHNFVLWSLTIGARKIGFTNRPVLAIAGLVGSVCFAIFLNWAIAKPIERFRGRLKIESKGVLLSFAVLAKS
jgi:peptidoglycan/LPS O-acetylase OafA/YrhL